MSHMVESGATRRHRKHRRTAITLLIVLALVAGAFYYAASYWKSPSRSAASGCPTTSTADPNATAAAAPAPPEPSQITVNVYNSTNRSGLAADVGKQVKARGFVVGTVANDPLKKTIAQPAQIRSGPNGQAAAAVVAALLPGAEVVQDARGDGSVDLAIGNGFQALAPAPTPTPGSTATTSNPC